MKFLTSISQISTPRHQHYRGALIVSVLLAGFVLCSVFAQHATAATENVPNPGVERIEGLDIALATAIRKELNITNADSPLTVEDMQKLTSLKAYRLGISSLKGLEHATNLTELYVSYNRIWDISPLRGLTNLTKLRLAGNAISDISALSGLTNLTNLMLGDSLPGGGNVILDISPLRGLTNLTYLMIVHNHITDVSPLSGLTNLTTLNLSYNKITDVSPLSSLTNLTGLFLDYNRIRDISPLAGLTALEDLTLDHNPIANIDPIKPLIPNLAIFTFEGTALTADDIDWIGEQDFSFTSTYDEIRGGFDVEISPAAKIPDEYLRTLLGGLEGTDAPTQKFISTLTELDLSGLNIKNFTGLESAINLTKLTITDANMTSKRLSKLAEVLRHLPDLRQLDLGGNKISNIASLASLTQLTSLHLNENDITDVSSLSALSDLTSLSLSENRIANIDGLGALTKLESLNLDGNRKVADISPLAGLTNLTDLFLSRNRIVDVSPLAGLTNLQRLTLDKNRIADFEPISSLIENLNQDYYRGGNQNADPIVKFRDNNLRRAVLEALGKDPNSEDSIKVSEMASLTTLTAQGASISDLTGIQHAVNLKTLDLSGNDLNDDDMDRLTRLTQLETLILTGNDDITSARPFRKLRNLTRLDLPQGFIGSDRRDTG